MSVARLHRRRKIIRRAEVIIIKVGWKLIISRGCRRRAEASKRASAHRGALCGVIRPTFCSANLSYLTSAALEDKQRRPSLLEKRGGAARRKADTHKESIFLSENEVALYIYCASENIRHMCVLLSSPLFGLQLRGDSF